MMSSMVNRILILKSLVIATMLLGTWQLSFAQANAGPDKLTCPGIAVDIGTAGATPGACYAWKDGGGTIIGNTPTISVTPTATTVYTLIVTETEFNSKSTDNVTVTLLNAGDCCAANAVVPPTSNPTVNNPAGSNDCTPTRPVLAWDACFDPATQMWNARVTTLTCGGVINIRPWPSQPNTMVVPNTANPVVGGNINNTAGSNNRWSYAISDMQNYDTPGGGAGPHWHSTGASSAHENFHWNTDWLVTSVGANWGAAETAIEALTVNSTTANSKAAAVTALTPLVTAEDNTFFTAVANVWNNTIAPADVPGGGGGGYAAGAAVLAGHIGAVQAFRTAQGW